MDFAEEVTGHKEDAHGTEGGEDAGRDRASVAEEVEVGHIVQQGAEHERAVEHHAVQPC